MCSSDLNTATDSASLTLSAIAVDGNYTLNFVVTIGINADFVATVKMNSVTVWTKTYVGLNVVKTRVESILIADTALAAGQVVNISVPAGTTFTASTMTYNTGIAPSTVSATPSGVSGIPFLIYPPTT